MRADEQTPISDQRAFASPLSRPLGALNGSHFPSPEPSPVPSCVLPVKGSLYYIPVKRPSPSPGRV